LSLGTVSAGWGHHCVVVVEAQEKQESRCPFLYKRAAREVAVNEIQMLGQHPPLVGHEATHVHKDEPSPNIWHTLFHLDHYHLPSILTPLWNILLCLKVFFHMHVPQAPIATDTGLIFGLNLFQVHRDPPFCRVFSMSFSFLY
jgi:hypothetical protein